MNETFKAFAAFSHPNAIEFSNEGRCGRTAVRPYNSAHAGWLTIGAVIASLPARDSFWNTFFP
jgi:hypothetical protein